MPTLLHSLYAYSEIKRTALVGNLLRAIPKLLPNLCTDLPEATLSTALEQGIAAKWGGVYDHVNPYGDRRGGAFRGVWTFDLDTDLLHLTKEDTVQTAPLKLARQGSLSLEDFQAVLPSPGPCLQSCTLSGPYWEPEVSPHSQRTALSGQILRDFGHAWRHVLRRTATRQPLLAYATVWISTLEFTIRERLRFDSI